MQSNKIITPSILLSLFLAYFFTIILSKNNLSQLFLYRNMSAVKVQVSKDSDSLVVKKGVTLIYACNNQDCEIFGKNASRNLGYLSFDFRREISKLRCVKCSTEEINVKGIGFFKINWTIKYIDRNRNEIIDSGPASNSFEVRGPIRLDI